MNFLGMGPMELMLILVLALIIFGPGKLPEIAGQVGRVVRDFRRTTSELSSEFNRTLSLEIEEKKASENRSSQPAATAVAEPAPVPVAPAPPLVTAEAAPDPLDYRIEPAEAPLSVSSTGSSASSDAQAPVAAASAEPAQVAEGGSVVAGRRRTYDADLAPPY